MEDLRSELNSLVLEPVFTTPMAFASALRGPFHEVEHCTQTVPDTKTAVKQMPNKLDTGPVLTLATQAPSITANIHTQPNPMVIKGTALINEAPLLVYWFCCYPAHSR